MAAKRYLITENFRRAVRDNHLTLGQLTKKVGFEVKNIVSRNKTIRESHLIKLNSLYSLPPLREIELNYSKNLGRYSMTPSCKILKNTAQLSELIGIILGDGNLCRNRVHISFDRRNKKYIRYVSHLFEDVTGVKLRYNEIKGTNQSYLYCYNQLIVAQLIRLGLKRGDKIINEIVVPDWIKTSPRFSKSCIRGLIDTDGCIYFCKRDRRRYIKFTNFNLALLKDFRKIAYGLGYSFVSANNHNVCLYRKDEVARFIKRIKPFKAIGDIV